MAATTGGNGHNDGPATMPGESHQLLINAQYVKDLSFENPRAPHSLMQPAAQPQVDINVDVKAEGLGHEMYEVVLTIKATAQAQGQPIFIVELAYAAVATIRNVPEPILQAMLLVETPRIIFPFARAIVSEATRDGGFMPLMINPIDFAELLRRQQPPDAAGEAVV